MKKIIMVFLLATVLGGCTIGPSVEQQLADTMAAMNDAEQDYREAQAELTSLEQSEQQLFNETMKLTQQQQEELTNQVAELEESLQARLKKLEQEEASINKAKASVNDMDEIVEKVDEQVKGDLEKLQTAISDRYGSHAEFIISYKKLAELQQQLYEMLRTEGTQLTELTKQVDEVNAQNETVQSTVIIFNDLTEQVNRLKDDVFASLQQGE
ncbi:YkyA family protein [Sporosarcina beigongshangi]|uniref:YkyA family protein n=1 Tax=Sporosarcina beigongshangi TaxID=2782538 RepID=UPI001939E43A|nr:YkyA family protein [Sporosarcina beigongshangi]